MSKKEILDLIDKTDSGDSKGFQKIIREVLDNKFISLKGMAHYFGVSFTAIRRWRGDNNEGFGSNAPHPVMRKYVLGWIKKQLAA